MKMKVVWLVCIVVFVAVGCKSDTSAALDSKPDILVIDIQDNGQGPQAADAAGHRLKHGYVRWVNHTSGKFLLEFVNDPNTSDDDLGPLDDGLIQIAVAPNQPTGLYPLADRANEHGKKIQFKYQSLWDPLSGPPGEPGMTVED